jgi:transposase
LADFSQTAVAGEDPGGTAGFGGQVRDHHRLLLKELLDEWKALGSRIRRIEKEIDRRIVPFAQAVELWEGIPGVDHVAACSLVAEIGTIWRSFHPLITWLSGRPSALAITRVPGNVFPPPRNGNKWLRRTLCQVAWAVTRKKDCYLSVQFRRLAARRGIKRAVMAVAHTMLVMGYKC